MRAKNYLDLQRYHCARRAGERCACSMERYLDGYVPPTKRQCVREEEMDGLIYGWRPICD